MNVRLAAPGVGVATLYANVFLLNTPQGRLLVDTGTMQHAPAFARLLRSFNPDAVLVTHSHIDHGGNAFLASRLGFPVLAHPLEHDRLTGLAHDLPYPAGKPKIGEMVSRLHPKVPAAKLEHITAGEDLLGWEIVHLPGHTDGQIGLQRNGILIAADAVVSSEGGAHLPRQAYNWNHDVALQTLKHMAGMDLVSILPGHGSALTPQQIRARAERDEGKPSAVSDQQSAKP